MSPNSISAMAELLVIIPCRNEAFNLPNLLSSFIESKKAGLQILVVDDQSTDETASIAKKFGADVCVTSNRPEGWSGKNWACHQGYEYSRKIGLNYKYILFTDADTIHSNLGLINAISWLNTQSADLLTARPYHRNPSFWEQLMGPFYLLILLITNAKEMRPKFNRFFSIGQFLLFKKEFYEYCGGHNSVKNKLAEDLALTQLCFSLNKSFVVYPEATLYSTRMYSTMKDFYLGWQRNFRLGMAQSSYQTWLEILIVVGALLTPPTFWSYALTSIIILLLQKKEGHFHFLGALFFPIGIIIFLIISLSAGLRTFLRKPIIWKTREYTQ